MTPPLGRLIRELSKGCPLCGAGPTNVQVLGADTIVLLRCGHTVNAAEWADEQHRAGETRLEREHG